MTCDSFGAHYGVAEVVSEAKSETRRTTSKAAEILLTTVSSGPLKPIYAESA